MAEEKDSTERTEEPTARRLEEALERGHVVFSREVTNFLFMLLFTALLMIFLPYLAKYLLQRVTFYWRDAFWYPLSSENDLLILAKRVVIDIITCMGLPLFFNMLASVGGSLLQNGLLFAPTVLEPKFDKLNPLNGLGRIFSRKNLGEFIKSLAKIGVIGAVSIWIIQDSWGEISYIVAEPLVTGLYVGFKLLGKLMLWITIIMAAIAGLDYFFERFFYLESLKMTKQELKEEMKQTEGNPEVKGKQRKIMMQMSRRRIGVVVPKATVVITNPTHYAVALLYDKDLMDAPKLVAKGLDNMALHIRKLASDNAVPIVENPPLARSLYESVEVDQFIPADFYRAVAEIIKTLRRG